MASRSVRAGLKRKGRGKQNGKAKKQKTDDIVKKGAFVLMARAETAVESIPFLARYLAALDATSVESEGETNCPLTFVRGMKNPGEFLDVEIFFEFNDLWVLEDIEKEKMEPGKGGLSEKYAEAVALYKERGDVRELAIFFIDAFLGGDDDDANIYDGIETYLTTTVHFKSLYPKGSGANYDGDTGLIHRTDFEMKWGAADHDGKLRILTEAFASEAAYFENKQRST